MRILCKKEMPEQRANRRKWRDAKLWGLKQVSCHVSPVADHKRQTAGNGGTQNKGAKVPYHYASPVADSYQQTVGNDGTQSYGG